MCGIVGAVSARNIVPVLVEGPAPARIPRLRLLRRGGAPGRRPAPRAQHRAGGRAERATSRPTISRAAPASRTRAGPRTARRPCTTRTRISRTARACGAATSRRRRTRSRGGRIALVHNGIIENHDELRAELKAKGYVFVSQTDTEVIAHLVDHLYDGDLLEAVQRALPRLRGAYAIAVFCRDEPHRVVGARHGSPLVLGVGTGRRERELPRLRRDGAGRRHRPDRLPRRRRRRRPAARQVLDQPRRRQGRLQAPCERPVRTVHRAHRRGRARAVPPLHAKGDLRAAEGDRRHARRGARHLARAVRRRRVPRLQGGRLGADPRLRHQLLQRLGREVLARSDAPRSRPASRSPANTATATACRTRARWSSRSRRAARPPTRWPR